SEIKKNGYKYEFGSKFKENGWLIDGPSFEPKGVLRRVKNRISKDHWINDNVAKYSKDSRGFIQTTNMTSKSNVLTIGNGSCEYSDKLPKTNNPQAYLEFDFEKRMQKLLLGGDKPRKLDETSVNRFAATEIIKNGKRYSEFGPDNFENNAVISAVVFDPKGVLLRIKNKIDKKHWVKENVIQYSKNSMMNAWQIVSDASQEEDIEIYQYLRYLNQSFCKK
ncbi:hypothetical protein M5D96_011268, partial [Drosophila gunungcola]